MVVDRNRFLMRMDDDPIRAESRKDGHALVVRVG